MARECVICGRQLKTGRKYCHVCRSIQKAKSYNRHKEIDILLMLWIASLFFTLFFTFLIGKITKPSILSFVFFLLLFLLWLRIIILKKKKKVEIEKN